MKDLFRLGRWVYPYKARLAAAVASSLIAVLCLTAGVVLIKPIIDQMIEAGRNAASEAPGGAVVSTGSPPATAGTASPSAPVPSGSSGLAAPVSSGSSAVDALPEELVGPIERWYEETKQRVNEALRIPEFKAWLAEKPFTRLPLLIVVLAILKGIFGYLAEFQIRWVGYRLISDLRGDLYDRILAQSVRFFSRHTTGQLMSRVLGDIGRLQKITSTNFAEFVRLFFTVTAFVFVVFYVSWKLSLLCLVGLPLLVYPVVRLSRRLKRASTQSQARAADLSHLLSESITGNRIVKGFGMESFESARFRKALMKMFSVDVKAVRMMALTPAILELVGAIYLAVLLFSAGTLIASGNLTTGALVPFVFCLAGIFMSVKKLSLMNNDLQQALGATSRVFEVYDSQPDVVEKPDARAVSPFSKAIELRGVSFGYDSTAVLEDVSLEIRAGQMIALVGQSGAGKTTLVNLIPRFYDVTGGALLMDGVDLRDATVRSVREQVALVTQETILFNDTVRNNIAYGNATIPDDRIVAAARAAHAHEFIEALPEKYDTVVGERGSRLSAGQRQRLTIARALLKNAPILILDEATSALDTESEALVQEALETLMQGRTSIVIAHRLSTVQRADRICVLRRGRIIESGTHRELLAAGGEYARLHAFQFRDEPSEKRRAVSE